MVDQTGSHHLMENRLEDEVEIDSKKTENTPRKDCSIRDQFLWTEEVSWIKD